MCEGYSSCKKPDFIDEGFKPIKPDNFISSDYVEIRNRLGLPVTAIPFTFEGNTMSAAAWVPEVRLEPNPNSNLGLIAYVAVLKLPCASLEDPATQYYGGALEAEKMLSGLDKTAPRSLEVIADDATVGCRRFTEALTRANALAGI